MTVKAKLEVERKGLTFQDLFLKLAHFWGKQGCVLQQPYDTEVGAGTMAPETFLRVLGPSPYRVAYVQPSRRPADGRYGENPNRLYKHFQYQVILKPAPAEIQDMYLKSLAAIGIDLRAHDVRFEEDNWEAPTLGAWGIGWQVMLDGLEITQFTYFQQCGGIELDPISVELTYGLERICAFLQDVGSVYEIRWNEDKSYGDIRLAEEQQLSEYSFDRSDAQALRAEFELHEKESRELLEGWKQPGGKCRRADNRARQVPLAGGLRPLSEVFAPVQFDGRARGDFDDGARGADGACAHAGVPDGGGVLGAERWIEERGAGMNVSARAESWDEKCRRADIPELEHGALGARRILLGVPRHFEGGFCPRNPFVASCGDQKGIHRTKNVRWKTVPHSADSVRNDGGWSVRSRARPVAKSLQNVGAPTILFLEPSVPCRNGCVVASLQTGQGEGAVGRSERSATTGSVGVWAQKLSARRQFQKLEVGAWGAPMSSKSRILERGMDAGAQNVGAPTFSIWNAGFGVAG